VVRSDSVVGFYSADPLRRMAIARADVTKIEVRDDTTPRAVRIAWKTYQAVFVVSVVALAVVVYMLSNDLKKLP
jgi:hypothetical protein